MLEYVPILDSGEVETIAHQPPTPVASLRPAYAGQAFDDFRLLRTAEETPAVTLHKILVRDAVLSFLPGLEGVVLTPEGRLIRETTFLTDERDRNLLVRSAAEAVQLGTPLLHTTDPWHSNYYHWLCVALGKSLLVEDGLGPEVLRVFPEFRRRTVLTTPGYSEAVRAQTLQRFSNRHPRMTLCPGLYRVPELHLLWTDHGEAEWHVVLPRFHVPFQAAAASVRGDRCNKILIVRRDDPRMSSDDQALIVNLGRSFGYEPVHLEDISFEDELRLFSNATHVVGPHGSGLANIIFCQPGTRVLELNKCLDGLGTLRPWIFLLANGAGHEYRYLNRRKGDFAEARLEEAFNRMEA